MVKARSTVIFRVINNMAIMDDSGSSSESFSVFYIQKNRHVCAISPIQAVFSGEFTVNTFMFMSPTKNQPKSPTFSLNLSLKYS